MLRHSLRWPSISRSIFQAHAAHTQAAALTLHMPSLLVSNSACQLIASHLRGGDVVQLIGKVGAGKTAMARSMIRAMLNNNEEVVQSPTFSLALSYSCSPAPKCTVLQSRDDKVSYGGPAFSTIHHIDAYR